MILRIRAVSWLALLLFTSEVRSGYYSKCYNDAATVSGYTLCLSTNTDVTATWSNAQTACANNGSTLIDVTSPNVTNILNSFRAESGSSLNNTGNWIDVYSPATLSNSFQWINGAKPPALPDFEVQNQDSSNPSTRRFAVIQRDHNNQLIYNARQHTDEPPVSYICHFKGTGVCTGGLVRNSSCYMKYNESLSWFDASNSCLQKGGSLAIFTDLGKPHNDANLTSWLNLNATSLSYWIGLVLPWWQRHDGGVIQYSNWENNKLGNQSQQQCVLIATSNKWTLGFGCDGTQRFVCQTIQPLSTQYTATTTSSSQSTLYPPSSTSSRPTTTSSTTSNMSTVQLTTTAPVGIIVGVVVGVGGALIIAAIVLVVWCCVIKRKRDTGRRESAMPLGSPRAENTLKSPTKLTTLSEVTTTTTTSPTNEIIYADIVKDPQSPDYQRNDQPDVVQSQNLIYAELAPPMK